MHIVSLPQKIYRVFNYVFMVSLALLCVLPVWHVLCISLSSSTATTAGEVTLWPVEFSLESYKYVLTQKLYLTTLGNTVKRVALGTVINLFMVILTSYPLSKERTAFRFRTAYVWFFVFTMLFGGGLIPWYMTIRQVGLMDTIWALVIPGAVPIGNVILMLNFFRNLPKELEEAAFVDGAGHLTILWKIYVPLSMASIATITLFTVVGHWNAWFDGLILMNVPEHYPLSTYLQTIIVTPDLSKLSANEAYTLSIINNRTIKTSQIFIAVLPVLLAYPFLQKYFIKGITLGSVKG